VAASAERSHRSLIGSTGSESIRVFQMLLDGKTSHLDPGTGAADAMTGTAMVTQAAHTASAAVPANVLMILIRT
jgi:hypothetical protein